MANTKELIYASKISQRKGRNIMTASTIKKVSIQSLLTAKNIKKSSKYLKSWEMDSEKALSLFLSAKMAKNSYVMVRNSAKADGFNYYPSYNKIREAKKMCYPENSAFTISETEAKVHLQLLLNHTCKRILEIVTDKILPFER